MIHVAMDGPQPSYPADPLYFEGPDDLPETVVIDGVAKEVTSLKSLNARAMRILLARGSASVYVSRADFLPIKEDDLKRRLAPEAMITGRKDGKETHKPAFPAWRDTPSGTFTAPLFFTSKPVADDVYNLFKGLGVKP